MEHGSLVPPLWPLFLGLWMLEFGVTERYCSQVNVKIFAEFGSFVLASPSSEDVVSECPQESQSAS